MIEWGTVPWTLWAFVALSTGVAAVSALTTSAPIALSILHVVLAIVWNFFLLSAVRWLWLASVGLLALALPLDLALGLGTWSYYVIGLTELGLLLLPATRRFFGKREAVPAT